jgi:hypothetical protein
MKSADDFSADWRRWSRAERILAAAVAAILSLGLAIIVASVI